MTYELATTHWALLSASVLGLAIVLFVLWRFWLDSAPGQLRVELRRLRHAEQEARKPRLATEKLRATLSHLQARADSVKPRRLEEVAGELQDHEALLKIANDKVLIARNHVRRIIVEEFPPKRHDAMRNKYLGKDDDPGRPFSF